MNGKTFEGLNNLKLVTLSGNKCIEEDFDDRYKIATLTRVVSEKCKFTEKVCATLN